MIGLIHPTEADKAAVMAYKAEFEANGDSMDGTAGLANAASFEEWLDGIRLNSREETVRKGLVPATTYLALNEEGRLVGMIDIRHRLNDHLFAFGGHIGYSVRKSERRRGYAAQMLALALNEAKKLGIDRVLVTCSRGNIASEKTILKNGGVFENELFYENEGLFIKRFWIDI